MNDLDELTAPVFPRFDRFSREYQLEPAGLVEEAHRTAPVFYDPKLGGWVLTRYDDVAAALRDSDTFSSANSRWTIPPPADIANTVTSFNSDRFILTLDPPAHTALRAPMQRALSKRLVDQTEPLAREVVNQLIDDFIDRGRCDLAKDFLYSYSTAIIVGLLGVPFERSIDYQRWNHSRLALTLKRSADGDDPIKDCPLSESEIRHHWLNLAEADAFFRGYVLDHQTNPREDMISAMLATHNEDGTPAFEVSDIIRTIQTLVAGGQDTSANLVANMLILFTRNPDQLALLQSDPDLMGNAIEESLRCLGSAAVVPRRAAKDVLIGGCRIPAGSQVYMMIHGANHDGAVFDEPHRFDIRRRNANRHLSLGFGRHACIGQALAKLEARVAIEEIYRRIPDLKIDFDAAIEYARDNIGAQKLDTIWAYWNR